MTVFLKIGLSITLLGEAGLSALFSGFTVLLQKGVHCVDDMEIAFSLSALPLTLPLVLIEQDIALGTLEIQR